MGITTRLLLSRQAVTRRDQLAAKPKKERGRGRGRGRGGRGGRGGGHGHGHGKEPELTDAEVWEAYDRWVNDDALWQNEDDEDKTVETQPEKPEKKRSRVIQDNVHRVGDDVSEAPVPSSSKPAKSTKKKNLKNEENPGF